MVSACADEIKKRVIREGPLQEKVAFPAYRRGDSRIARFQSREANFKLHTPHSKLHTESKRKRPPIRRAFSIASGVMTAPESIRAISIMRSSSDSLLIVVRSSFLETR